MEMIKSQNKVLNNIPFALDPKKLFSKLKMDSGSEYAKELQELMNSVSPMVKPKAIYKVCYIESRNGDIVNIDGVEFTSRVLKTNLEKVERVFPFIATCGDELENLDIPQDDFLQRYWIDTIKEMALSASINYLYEHIKKKYALKKLPSMSPGSGAEGVWHIEQQKQLFSLFGNVEEQIGVKLTDSYLMIPNKSLSGMCFSEGIEYITCQLCPREKCPGRKAPYNKKLERDIF